MTSTRDNNKPDVLPKVSYSQCGFSRVAGDHVGVFDVYVDESGNHDEQRLAVGGFVAETDKWTDFSAKWNHLLSQYQITYFRMKQFKQPKCKRFNHLSLDKKAELFESLLGLIKETVLFGSFSLISPQLYTRLTTPEFRREFGTAYGLSAARLVSSCRYRLQVERPGNYRLGVFLCEGHKNVGNALELIRFHQKELEEVDVHADKYPLTVVIRPEGRGQETMTKSLHPSNDPFRRKSIKLGAIGTGISRGMPPLQAADILTHCAHMVGSQQGEEALTILSQIAKNVPCYLMNFTTEKITELVDGTWEAEDKWKRFAQRIHQFSQEMRDRRIEVSTLKEAGVGIRSLDSDSVPSDVVERLVDIFKDRS